jgi:hypothetical protein
MESSRHPSRNPFISSHDSGIGIVGDGWQMHQVWRVDANEEPVSRGVAELQRILQVTRANVLLTGADEAIDTAMNQLGRWFASPIRLRYLPGPLQLADVGSGALVLRDVSALDRMQQRELIAWTDKQSSPVQIISATSANLLSAVARGAFNDRLYRQLSTIIGEI